MSKKSDWVAKGYEELYDQSNQTRTYLSLNMEKMGIEGANARWVENVFNKEQTNYADVFLAWQNPAERTPLKVVAIKDAKITFVPTYRQLYTGLLKNNPNVTNEDLVAMALPERSSKKPTPVPPPTTRPEHTVETALKELIIHFRDAGSKSKAKPAGVGGALIRWEIRDTPPTKALDLLNSALDTATPFTLQFTENQRGNRVYFALAWQSTKGEVGPWSEIGMAIIP